MHTRGYYGYARDNEGAPRLMWIERIEDKAGESYWITFTGSDEDCYAEMIQRNHVAPGSYPLWPDDSEVIGPVA